MIDGTTPRAVLEAWRDNMERFGICRSRHHQLIDAVRARQ